MSPQRWLYPNDVLITSPLPPEAEAIVAEDNYYTYVYVMDVLKHRFVLGEPVLAQNNQTAGAYLNAIIAVACPHLYPEVLRNLVKHNPALHLSYHEFELYLLDLPLLFELGITCTIKAGQTVKTPYVLDGKDVLATLGYLEAVAKTNRCISQKLYEYHVQQKGLNPTVIATDFIM